MVLAGATLAACMKSNSGNDPQAAPPSQKGDKYYSGNEPLKTKTVSASRALGLAVKLKNDNDFANEYNYHRILDLLMRQQSRIHEQLTLLEGIMIDGTTQIEPQGARYIVHLGYNISENDLVDLISLALPNQHHHREAERRFALAMRPNTISVVDLIGFRGGDIDAISSKLAEVATAVDFSSDSTFTTLQLSNTFAIVPSGMLINVSADADTIAQEIRAGIRARGYWQNEVVPTLRTLALEMTYQPGVFNAEQLMQVSEFAKRTARMIKGIPSVMRIFVVGHRFNADLAAKTMLLDYKASDLEVSNQIVRLKEPAPTVVDFAVSKEGLLNALKDRNAQILQVEVDMPATAENIELVKRFTEQVVPLLDIESLNKLGYRVLQLNAVEVASTQAVLSIRLPASYSELNYRFASLLTMREFADLTEAVNLEVARMGVPLAMSTLIASQPVNKGLKDIKLWLSEKASDYLLSKRVQSVTVIVDSTAVSTFKTGLLTINLSDFSKERIERLLK